MKYSYTDPLKAAIAVRDYGVVIYAEYEEDVFISMDSVDLAHDRAGGGKYHVDPDSNHIFEPQEGDYLELPLHGSVPGVYYGEMTSGGLSSLIGVKIILRNGKYFPWPEVEEV